MTRYKVPIRRRSNQAPKTSPFPGPAESPCLTSRQLEHSNVASLITRIMAQAAGGGGGPLCSAADSRRASCNNCGYVNFLAAELGPAWDGGILRVYASISFCPSTIRLLLTLCCFCRPHPRRHHAGGGGLTNRWLSVTDDPGLSGPAATAVAEAKLGVQVINAGSLEIPRQAAPSVSSGC